MPTCIVFFRLLFCGASSPTAGLCAKFSCRKLTTKNEASKGVPAPPLAPNIIHTHVDMEIGQVKGHASYVQTGGASNGERKREKRNEVALLEYRASQYRWI